MPRVGARGWPGPRGLGRSERGRAARAQAPQRPRPRPHRPESGLRPGQGGSSSGMSIADPGARPAGPRRSRAVPRAPTPPASARSTGPGGRPVEVEALGQPAPVVRRRTRAAGRPAGGGDDDHAPRVASSSGVVAVLDGVLEHLGEHHRQRGGRLGGQHPEAPVRRTRTRSPAALTSVTIRPSRSAISSKSTCSSTAWLSVSCTIAIEPTRRTASSSAALASRRVDPPGLEPQQRGHGLQVVLHPVVDLADGGVLGDQLAVAAAQVGDVAHQDQRADVLALRPQRDGPHDQHAVVGADLGVAVGPPAEHRAQRLLVGAVRGGTSSRVRSASSAR